jgi:sugar lactone lactonase YvrE
MKTSFRRSFMFILTLLALTFSALGVTPVSAAITVTDGMAATLVLGQANFTSGGTGSGTTGMTMPTGVAIDPTTGKVFVSDRNNNRVLRFAAAASLTNGAAAEAVLGQPDFSTTSTGTTQSKMNVPMGIAVDSAGRLWVSDQNNHRVLRFDSASTLNGGDPASAVLGQADFVSLTSGTSQNKFNSPEAVFVDSAGTLWVADNGNNRVLRFDNAASKTFLANADGVLGKSDFVTNSCTWTATTMCSPYGMYMSSTGTLWVADGENYRILRFDNAASKANGAAADGVLGQPDFTTRDPSVTSQNRMSQARGLAFDDSTGTLYVMNGDANRILVFNNAAAKANGANADNVIGQVDFTSSISAPTTAASLAMPWGGFFDPATKVLWVTSWYNHRVLMYGTPTPPCSSAITVTSNADSGAGTLRQAIADVCAGGTITFDSGLSGATITLTTGEFTLSKNVTIDGSALASQVAISGNNSSRSFTVNSGVTATLKNLTIKNGLSASGGGIANSGTLTIADSTFSNNNGSVGASDGGAIWNYGTLAITKSTFTGNIARHGGGLWNYVGTATISDSLFTGNTASGVGGGLGNWATSGRMTVTNSTFTNNTSASTGGGMATGAGSIGTVANSTFYNNSAVVGGAIYIGRDWTGGSALTLLNDTVSGNSASSSGGGVYNDSVFNYSNTIVANSTGGDCVNAWSLSTNTNNLVKDGSCSPAVSGDPALGALANNGGPTQTMALQAGSPALGAGNAAACAAAPVSGLDQRGQSRPQGDTNCDIGAFESNVLFDSTAPQVSSILRASGNPTSAASVNFTVTFSEAVTGVSQADFTLATTGVTGASITGMTPVSASVYTVAVGTGSGNGDIRLDVPATASVADPAGNPLAGLPYTGGESYTVNKGAVTPPSVPALLAPAINFLTSDYTPILDWANSTLPAGATFDHYQIQIATDAAFSSPVIDENIAGITNSTYTPSVDLAHNTKFYWRVRAANLAGGTSNWSLIRYFRTLMDAPTLVSPANGFDSLSQRPAFDWDDVTGPSGVADYIIQISKNNTFTQVVHIGLPTASSYVPTADLPRGGTLFWRVQSRGVNGPSTWSEVRSFSSANAPAAPVLLLPLSNTLNTSYLPLFKWMAVTMPAGTTFQHYQLQVDDNADFSSPVIDDTSITNRLVTQFQVAAPLAHNVKFYWRVRVVNTDNETSNWSTISYFRTLMDAPALVSPANGFNSLSLRPAFDWDDVTGPGAVTGYVIQISKNNTFTLIADTGKPTTSNYVPAVDLPKNMTLFWRVLAVGANGPSVWSEVRSFNSANAPVAPVLSLPASNALTNYLPLFKWTVAIMPAGATFQHYQLQVDDNVDFSSPVIDDTSVTNRLTPQFQTLIPFAQNTRFYWRVRVVNTDSETSNWSKISYFSTRMEAPTLVSPANGFDALSLRPAFDWDNVAGPGAVTGYTIQISKNSTFTQIVHTGLPAASSYIPTADLPKGVTLFWRVQSRGVNGPSVWSEVRSFNSANSPAAPALSLPASNALTNYLPLFKWTVVTLPAGTTFQYYQIQVDDNADFSSPVIDNTSVTNRLTPQFQVTTPLAQNTRFYWRVRVVNADNETSNWSLVRYFRTVIAAPTLLTPVGGAPAGSRKPTFDWENAAGPGAITNYAIQVSTSPTFSTLLLNKASTTSTYTPPANLPAGKTLYWRVMVNGANGPSAWSTSSFTTP